MRIVPNTARPTRQVRPTIWPFAVAYARDTVQRALDARAVVGGELADAGDDGVDVLLGDLRLAEDDLFAGIARLRHPAEVEDDFEQLEIVRSPAHTSNDVAGENVDERVQVVGDVQHLLTDRNRLARRAPGRALPPA